MFPLQAMSPSIETSLANIKISVRAQAAMKELAQSAKLATIAEHSVPESIGYNSSLATSLLEDSIWSFTGGIRDLGTAI
jgi:hypothetical protein